MVLALFFGGDKETRISESVVYPDTNALVCESDAKEEAFFYDTETRTAFNKIKVLFTDDRPSQLFYSYTGKYDSEKIADSREASFHSKYNKYLSEKNISQSKLLTTFAHVNNEVRIDIYGEIDKITRDIGVFFFAPEDGFKSFTNYDSGEMKKFYEENGFSCIISN